LRAALALGLVVAASAVAAEGVVLEFRSAKGTMALGPEPVARVSLGKDVTGAATVELELVPKAAEDFAALTAESVGMEMAMLVCGEVVIAPVVQEPITGGRVVISGPGAGKAAGHLAALQGESPCP
jgi:preprotein translocase subunit SecD